MESLLSATRLNDEGDCLATTSHCFAEMVMYVRDDGNDIYGFATAPSNPPLIRSLFQRGEEFWSFLPEVDVFFSNYDGIYWALFTRHIALLETVKNDLRRDARIQIIETSLRETLAIHEREAQEGRALEQERMRQKPLRKRAHSSE